MESFYLFCFILSHIFFSGFFSCLCMLTLGFSRFCTVLNLWGNFSSSSHHTQQSETAKGRFHIFLPHKMIIFTNNAYANEVDLASVHLVMQSTLLKNRFFLINKCSWLLLAARKSNLTWAISRKTSFVASAYDRRAATGRSKPLTLFTEITLNTHHELLMSPEPSPEQSLPNEPTTFLYFYLFIVT